MNKYDIGWRDSLRLRTGLTAGMYPSKAPTYAIRLLIVAGLWLWAMDRDYAEEQRLEANVAIVRAMNAEKQLMDCLNGRGGVDR